MITRDWIVMFVGMVVGLFGGFLAGDDLQGAPIRLKIAISLAMIGVSIIGFGAGFGRTRNGNVIKTEFNQRHK